MRLIFSTEDGDKEVFRHVLLRVMNTYEDRPQVKGKDVPAELLFLDDDDLVEYPEKSRFISVFISENDIGPAPPVPEEDKDISDDRTFNVSEE